MADPPGCHYCSTTIRELRPYGPGGSMICFPCMKADSERERSVEEAFYALLQANAVIGNGVVAIGTSDGPVPFEIPQDADDV
jgi:hypothetical protein